VKDLVHGTPVVNWREASKDFVHLQDADIPTTKASDRVQVLLGADYMHLMAATRSLIGKENKPTAELCRLGWAFAGRVRKSGSKNVLSGLSYTIMMTENDRPRLSDHLKKQRAQPAWKHLTTIFRLISLLNLQLISKMSENFKNFMISSLSIGNSKLLV
jgi:hypothetical protein